MDKHRPLHVIAGAILIHWQNPHYSAKPYIEAMLKLNSIDSTYINDSARDIVARFLGNAKTWRGPNARRIKTELNSIINSQ